MITVSKENLTQIRYLIDQAKQGNHLLFDTESLLRVFRSPPQAAPTSAEPSRKREIDSHIERIFSLPTLAQQRAYIERLDPEMFELLVQSYFRVIENNLAESKETLH